jgi:type IV secretory pathway ATPase VirB11/archaellum biosynthesis ATPase
MSTATLDQALDAVMRLSTEQRKMLVDILRRREAEANRQEIADEATRSLATFHAGEYRALTANEAIEELRSLLEQDE